MKKPAKKAAEPPAPPPSPPPIRVQEKIVFPYATWAEALKDGFGRIGGYDEAFRFMRKGYQTVMWRKRSDASSGERKEG